MSTPVPQRDSRRLRGLLILLAIYVVVAHVVPRPAVIEPAGWRLLGIFVATVAGLMLRMSLIDNGGPGNFLA